jgi:hypothetical protein
MDPTGFFHIDLAEVRTGWTWSASSNAPATRTS